MSREVHVRFCEGPGVQLPRATLHVTCFQYRADAERFSSALRERLGKFRLTIADGKTQLMVFGRFADERAKHQGERPGRFDFLGFTHVSGRDQQGRFAVIRIPSVRSCRRFLAQVKAWLRAHLHAKRLDQQKHLGIMLRGFYEYFSLAHSQPKLKRVRHEVELQWLRALRHRGQRTRLRWDVLCDSAWFALPPVPRTIHATV